jgi:ribulose-phosphate 3-epimerase
MGMPIICPTVTAFDTHEYRVQMERLEPFATRIHIDLMDGKFAPTTSPGLDQVWWPEKFTADIHLMYQDPMAEIDQLIYLKPNLVIIHQEAAVNHREFADRLRSHGIKAGLALLPTTLVEQARGSILSFDHVLIFSGDLGKHGGVTDTSLLPKILQIKQYHPNIEVGWDGGVNDENAATLIDSGVEVLNVGGFIQKADDPAAAYAKLKAIQ